MIEEDLWKPYKLKKIVTHQLRERRACFGELVQIDGSPHDWLEGRAEACVLLYNIFHTCTTTNAVRRKCKQAKPSEVILAKDLNKTTQVKPHKPALTIPGVPFCFGQQVTF